MDAATFGLTRNPFTRDPGTDEACLPPSRAKLLDTLVAESRGRGPTIAVIGDPGTGKSAFAAVLATRIGRERRVALAAARSTELAEIIGRLVADRVILVDDAHLLERSSLETLCATRTERLILIGREPLAQQLASLSRDAPVRTHRLAALSREEATAYFARRVAAAGGRADVLFSDEARNRLVDVSHGLASVLESVAAECLRRAQDAGLSQVGVEIVDRALSHVESAGEAAEPPAEPPAFDPVPRPWPPAASLPGSPSPWIDASPPERTGRRVWWLVGGSAAVFLSLALWKGLSEPGDAGRPGAVARPSPIHGPVARTDTSEAPQVATPPATPQGTIPPIRASVPLAPAPPPVAPQPVARPPAAHPPPAPREPASRELRWVVQVGAFRSEANAKTAFEELRRLDPGAVIERRKGLLFVVSRPFASEAEAAAFERRLEAAGMSTLVRERHEP
jgi:type II secretory pathway predicted ATPase ExeA